MTANTRISRYWFRSENLGMKLQIIYDYHQIPQMSITVDKNLKSNMLSTMFVYHISQ